MSYFSYSRTTHSWSQYNGHFDNIQFSFNVLITSKYVELSKTSDNFVTKINFMSCKQWFYEQNWRNFTTKKMLSIFPLWTFHLYVATFQYHLHMGNTYLSWSDNPELVFLDKGLQLTRKLLEQGFLVVKLKSLLRKFYVRHHDMVNRYRVSVSQITTDMFRFP
jgi:hypothetical protein